MCVNARFLPSWEGAQLRGQVSAEQNLARPFSGPRIGARDGGMQDEEEGEDLEEGGCGGVQTLTPGPA